MKFRTCISGYFIYFIFAFRLSAYCFSSSSSKSSFSKYSFGDTIRVSNSLDPDQVRRFVGPGLGPNCLQRYSADGTSRRRVKHLHCHVQIYYYLSRQIFSK